ncbi:ribose 5-phosphate isomerase B [Paenibacillus antarcticus]|uniref:Ribose-5-phosphate isomerase n=1 Tax=Paenibacillus antarcticus TaxID=253703 RepID=A0A168QDG7_9BACL|nr:ribose 5-phosphate isomerase B [Paenibacillus antarcticus]OAB47663.1 ribose-5-phosphate isomerase [Paenibacillus antarcticus]
MRIALGTDHGGIRLKQDIMNVIEKLGHVVVDVGCDCSDAVDYPDYALPVCEQVISGEADRGILVCGTGIGMSIAANKVPGIRCALVHDTFSAKATREHNDTNVLALGERVIGPGLACEIVKEWLVTEFSGEERHVNRVNKIKQIEDRYTQV